MENILPLFYYIILLIIILFSLVIVYHIWKYSYNKATAVLMLLIFASVAGILLITNITLFFALDFSEINKLFF